MDDQKKQIIDKLKQATNILVTVKSDPSIDQLAACIGLTLVLNELGKHATAVFSGTVPSVLEFLHPEKTLETNTDSLRDFIIALDKSKADKLRYKVEDKVVKIFITPYRTSISDSDLEFSQGDFNVDVVVALGVHNQDELDQAITEHGKILHDATVMSITTDDGEKLGTVNWLGGEVSSLSEMVASIADQLGKKDILDNQIATALLTGIVSETERFSNNKTTPQTMSVSAKLLTAGANQELVASKLAEPVAAPEPEKVDREDDDDSSEGSSKPEPKEPPKSNDGTLSIDHTDDSEAPAEEELTPPEPKAEEEAEPEAPAEETPEPEHTETKSIELPRAEAPSTPPPGLPADEQAALDLLKNRQIQVDEHGVLQPIETEHRDFLGDNDHPLIDSTPATPEPEENPAGAPFDITKFALTPPSMGGTLTANSQPEGYDPSTDPLTMSKSDHPQILSHEKPGASKEESKPAEKPSENSKPAEKKPEQPTKPKPTPAAPTVDKPAPVAEPKPETVVSATSEVANEPLIAPAFPMPNTSAPTAETQVPKTLEELEKEVHSAHIDAPAPEPTPAAPAVEPAVPNMPAPADLATSASDAHPALQAALQDTQPTAAESTEAPASATEPALTTPGGTLQAQPLSTADMAAPTPAAEPPMPAPASAAPTDPSAAPHLEAQTMDMPLPTLNMPAPTTTPATSSPTVNPTAPPPVPPPLMPPPVGS